MISLEQKVKFILIAWVAFFGMWVIAAFMGIADKDQLVGYIVATATGLSTAAMIIFDVKRGGDPPQDRKTDAPDKQVLP